MDYKENFDFFLDSMKQFQEEKDKINEEGQLIYSQETQEKHKLIDNSVIVKFNEELLAKANVLETTITAFLETSTSDYASIFLKSLSDLQNILNESNELVLFSQNIQKDLNNKKIHIHLIQTFVNLFETLKVKINDLQDSYETINKEIESTINRLKVKNHTTEFDPNDFEYIAKLSNEDIEVLGVQYVKGDLIFDNDIPKQFVSKNEFIKTIVDLSNNEGYYTTSNNKIRKVKVSPVSPEIQRKVQTQTFYYVSLNEKDQILSGVYYVMCDKNGNVLYENEKLVPFFPNYLELKKDDNDNFIQTAPNKVDTITYTFIKKLEESYPKIYVVNEAKYDILINPLYSNIIDPFYKNKYFEINVDSYVAPFTISKFLVNSGDFFLINNTSKFPITFNISKKSDDKRIILYQNQIVCFVFSERSDILQYGFLLYKVNETTETTSNLVAQVNTTNDYIFMTSKLVEDKKEIIPLLDSHKNLIRVPNFDVSGSLYYSPDDYFNKDPIKVSIIDPVQLNTISFSNEYSPIFTNYVCLIKFDIFVFCDENGVPVLNKYGYFQPVITPIHYSNNKYFYYAEDKMMYITIKEKNESVPNIEESYGIASQNVTPFSIKYKETSIFSDSFGNPIIYNKSTFGQVPNEYSTEMLPTIISDNFELLQYDIEGRKNYIVTYYLNNMINTYRNQTTILYNHFKDLSGNINNLGSYLLDFEMLEKQLDTTKDVNLFQDIQSTFDKVNELYTKLNDIEKIKTEQITDMIDINDMKIDKLNILNPLETKLKEIKEKITSLQNPDDLNFLFNTVNKLDQTINIVKDNISTTSLQTGGGNSIDFLKTQDSSIQIVKASLDILEQNLNSSLKALEYKKNEDNEKVLKDKNDLFISMEKSILDETSTINDYKNMDEYYMSRAPMDYEDDFNRYHITLMTNIKTIESVINKIKSGKSFETPRQNTAESIDKNIAERNANLELIETTKKNTKELFKKMDAVIEEASKNELNRTKKDILNLINDFELQHTNIEELNNKLKLKELYEINPNLLEVQQIKNTIIHQQDKDILKDNYKEIYDVYLREKDILNELQMKEVTTIGGAKKKSTRKTRRVNRK